MTARSIVVSLVAHGALIALALRCSSPEAPPPASPREVEIVEVPVPPPPAPVRVAAPTTDAPAPARRRPTRPRRAAPAPIEAEPLGDLPVPGSGSGSGDGSGSGSGALRPGSSAPSLGASGQRRTSPPVTPAPPPRSKARPARLVFPKKHRTEEDGHVFVALLTVDDEGYVVGVRLTRGVGGRRDEIAQREVWRFRYDPARDDAGRPVGSRVEQRFMLDR